VTIKTFDYSLLDYDIRDDLPQAYREIWVKIASPGNWWNGSDRVAIAAEVRKAQHCALCIQRKAALSPFSVQGNHDTSSNLPPLAVDAIHRIVTDVSRLTESWLTDCLKQGLSHEQYIELLGIVVAVISIDAFHRAMGIELEVLPEALPGEPDHYRPATAVKTDAWVATIAASAASDDEADLYGGMKQSVNVLIAMSLVPDSVRMLLSLSAVQYLDSRDVPNPSKNAGREISRAQMELLAGRISAMSDCFY